MTSSATVMPKTVLPDGLTLNHDDTLQLYAFEKRVEKLFSDEETKDSDLYVDSRGLIASTTNEGIYYYCLENNFELKYLAVNKHISRNIMLLLLTKLQQAPYFQNREILDVYYRIVIHPLLHNDLNLLKTFLTVFPKSFDPTLVKILISVAQKINAEGFLFLNSIIDGNFYSHEHKQYLLIAASRKKELIKWIIQKDPSLASLPDKWILRAHNIPIT